LKLPKDLRPLVSIGSNVRPVLYPRTITDHRRRSQDQVRAGKPIVQQQDRDTPLFEPVLPVVEDGQRRSGLTRPTRQVTKFSHRAQGVSDIGVFVIVSMCYRRHPVLPSEIQVPDSGDLVLSEGHNWVNASISRAKTTMPQTSAPRAKSLIMNSTPDNRSQGPAG